MIWYEDDVLYAEAERNKCFYKPETVFYGSSSFTLWKTIYEDFHLLKPVNLGFGGSTLAACVWYFERIVTPLNALKRLVLYAGDNDLGDGRRPEEVFLFYREFNMKLREHYSHIPFFFVSIKPSIKRKKILDQIVHTNELIKGEIAKKKGNDKYIDLYRHMVDNSGKPIKAYFTSDGLHLNEQGYELWKREISSAIS